MDFVPAFLPVAKQTDDGWWFIFCGDKLLVKEEGAGCCRIPSSTDVSGLIKNLMRTHSIGRLEGTPCYASEVPEEVSAPQGMTFQELRTLLGNLDEDIFSVAGRAFQYLDWDRNHSRLFSSLNLGKLELSNRVVVSPMCQYSADDGVLQVIY